MPGDGLTHGPPARKNAGGRYHRCSRIIRHSLRDGFHAYTQSPWCAGLCGHHVATTRLRALRWTPASGCQDPATSRPHVAVRPHTRKHAAAPTRPSPPRLACRDDRAQRPSVVRRDGRDHRRDLPDGARCTTATDWHDGQFAHGGYAQGIQPQAPSEAMRHSSELPNSGNSEFSEMAAKARFKSLDPAPETRAASEPRSEGCRRSRQERLQFSRSCPRLHR
jgi:hypothetical protein